MKQNIERQTCSCGGQLSLFPTARAAEGTLYVVPCSAGKTDSLRTGPVAARHAYAGLGFRMAVRQLEEAGAQWCILSGLYGFLWPETEIEYYEKKIEAVKKRDPDDTGISMLSIEQYQKLCDVPRLVILGSRLYAENASFILGRDVEAPFAGLPIGKMLQAIKRSEWLVDAN